MGVIKTPSERRAERFFELLKKLGIPRDDRRKWQKLGLVWVHERIPGFRLTDISNKASSPTKQTRLVASRGRPPIYNTPQGRAFLEGIRKEGEELLRNNGLQRVSDIAAIKAWFMNGKVIQKGTQEERSHHRVAVMLAKKLSAIRRRPKSPSI